MTRQKYTHQCKKCQEEITSFTLEGPEKCPHCYNFTWDVENGYDPKHLLLEHRDNKGRYRPSKVIKDRSDNKAKNLRPSSLGYL